MARQTSAPIATFVRHQAVEDVCELIAAAGPLTVEQVARGLSITEPDAAVRVRSLEARGDVRPDEWGRYRLAGARQDMWL
jgi:hypothetical protein